MAGLELPTPDGGPSTRERSSARLPALAPGAKCPLQTEPSQVAAGSTEQLMPATATKRRQDFHRGMLLEGTGSPAARRGRPHRPGLTPSWSVPFRRPSRFEGTEGMEPTCS
mmetsp:Transcript_46014/g.99366  ORF Transcript_46014/g.99366 Transcript_46014/m.99366 type:complete len:111 (+) Transcript_46014:379-711(+)